jgi:hypothetical protein
MEKSKAIIFHPTLGVTLRIAQSEVVVRFKFPKRTFRDYVKSTMTLLQVHALHGDTINASDRGLPAPVWIICQLAAFLAEAAAGCAKPKDEGST